jgi:protein phosphatase-4 regulatory subunit 3
MVTKEQEAAQAAAQAVDTKENDSNSSPVTKKRKIGESSSSASASSPSSEETTEDDEKEGWRVKLYKLNTDGSWDDCGTGRILVEYHAHNKKGEREQLLPSYAQSEQEQEPMLHLQSEPGQVGGGGGVVLLHSRILIRDAYQRQGDNIITWCEPFFGNRQTVDLALSFQDNAGCLDIWRQITSIQQNVQDNEQQQQNTQQHIAAAAAAHAAVATAAHHVELQQQQQQQQQQQSMWEHVASKVHNLVHSDKTEQVAVSMAAAAAAAYTPHIQPLPNPPCLDNLEEIADIIAAGQVCVVRLCCYN